MSPSSADKTIVSAVPPARELRVINWPVRDDPGYAFVVFATVAACAMLVAWAAEHTLPGLLTLAALLLTTWRLWLPITCELSPSGMTLQCLGWRRQILWRQIERVDIVRGGVLLQCRRADGTPPHGIRFYVPWRRHPQLVAEFHEYSQRPTGVERRVAGVERSEPPDLPIE